MQLRFTSFAVVSLRKDFHLQDRAHAGRTTKKARQDCTGPKVKRPLVVTFSLQVPALAQLLGQQAQVPSPRQPLLRVVRPPVALAAQSASV